MKRKILSLFMALLTIASIVSGTVISASALTEGDYEYKLINGNKEVQITKYVGPGGDVYIPNKIAGKPVTQIGDSAFSGNEYVTSVWMGENVTSIGKCSFENCSSLKSIEFPDSLTSIGEYYSNGAFEGCSSLESVVFGNGIEYIPRSIFENCSNLTSVVFGQNVKTIAQDAFRGTGIISIDLPDSLTAIQSTAFYGCTSLSNIDFGGGLNSIATEAFQNCSSLKSLVFPDSLTSIGEYYSNGAFEGCSSLESVVFGNGIEYIPRSIFENCSNIKSVVFGQNVKTVARDAFSGCTALTDVYFLGDAPTIDGEIKAAWHSRPDANGFTSGNVSDTYITVTVDTNGGKTVFADTTSAKTYTKFADNGHISAPIVPVREGYTFVGWYLAADGSGKEFDFNNDTATEDTTLYAKWEINTYRIFFDPRGGKVTTGGKTVTYGEPIGELPTPTLAGDKFEGWYPGMNSSGPKYSATSKMPAKDLVLYAGWAKTDSALTVIFDTHGGNFIAPVNAVSGQPISAPAVPTRDGFEFVAWYKDPSYNERFTFNKDTITANTTLHALWKRTLPAAPDVASPSEITSKSITVTWSPVAGADGYNIYLNGLLYNDTPVTGTSYVIDGLEANTDYTVKVVAVNTYGEGSSSAEFEFTTPEVTDMYGDVDGNKIINLNDVSLILKYIAKWEVNINTVTSDVNGDGNTNLTDASMILKFIAKWDIALGK